MNGVPHRHNARLERETVWFEFYAWGVTYGDTFTRLLPAPLGAVHPRKRLVERAMKRAIAKHDRGSLRAAKRDRKREAAEALLGTIQSDWWMNSQERMDELHGQANYENSIRERDREMEERRRRVRAVADERLKRLRQREAEKATAELPTLASPRP